jgi:crotonobetainyl-CoA:carnitine CoA-transferase CaiB-like acyl-CoA transferase
MDLTTVAMGPFASQFPRIAADKTTGLIAAIAILAALRGRDVTRSG